MKVSRFVIHELIKDLKPRLASRLLDLEKEVIRKLAVDLVTIYQKKSSVIWGKFDLKQRFPASFKEYIGCAQDDKDFFELTSSAMERLEEEMKGTAGTGGYICFVEYYHKGSNHVLIAMIKNTEGVKLKNLTPQTDIHIDKSRLYQAIDINFSSYVDSIGVQGYTKSYLAFISKKGEPSGYFQEAFACIDNVTPSVAVNKTPVAAKKYVSSFVDDKGCLKELERRIYDYYKSNVGKTITLDKISDIVNGFIPDSNPEGRDGFIEFAKSDEWQLPDSFQAVKGSVEKLVNISLSTDEIGLSFAKAVLGLEGRDIEKSIMYRKGEELSDGKLIVLKLPGDFVRMVEDELGVLRDA